MKKVNIIIGTLASAVVTTIVILVISLVTLLFTHNQTGHASAFFNSVFVNVEENTKDWDLYTTMGVNTENVTPIILTIIFFWGLYFTLTKIYTNRKTKHQNIK